MGGETEKGVSIIFAFVSALGRELCRSKILLTNRYNLGTDFTENTEKIKIVIKVFSDYCKRRIPTALLYWARDAFC